MALARVGSGIQWLRNLLTNEILRGVLTWLIGGPLGARLAEPMFTGRGDLPELFGPAFGMWIGFALSHALVTWWAFRAREGEELRTALRVGDGWERQRAWWRLIGSDGPMWAIGIAFTAMVALGVLLGFKSVRGVDMLLAAGLLVLASWLDVMITFAALYARLDLGKAGPMLRFPDDERPRVFSDYVYVAITVMATFGVSDASVSHPRLRRQVATHSFIAFMFNTVIVAVLVSLVVTLAG